MKKVFLIVGLLVAAFLITGTVLVVQAQTPTPETEETEDFDCPNWNGEEFEGGFGGMMGRGRGMMGRFADDEKPFGCGVDGEFGPMHEVVVNALAEATGLSVEEINEKLTSGETTMFQIASDAGLSEDEITALFSAAHAEAWEAAGVDTSGSFYQNMLERMKNRFSNGEDFQGRGCHGGFGGRMGRWVNPES